MADLPYPRDLVGYGRTPPDAAWPGGAHVAVQFVVNFEEGGENCILHGDAASEAFLSDVLGTQPWPGMRHMNVEFMYEYGARAGFWRIWRYFVANNIPTTVYGVATALQRVPQIVAAMKEADWEIASHGYKWVDHRDMPKEEERRQVREAIRLHTEVTGAPPLGWYTGRSSLNTLDLVMEEGNLLYASDTYADDLPYSGVTTPKGPHLIIPYTLDANDMRFINAQGFSHGEDFFTYLKDSFDVLYEEGLAGAPKMMSVGLHCRLAGRPGRFRGLQKFVEYIRSKEKVWIAKRVDIARHWHAHHKP